MNTYYGDYLVVAQLPTTGDFVSLSMKRIRFSGHAKFEMRRRGISGADVEAVVRNPGQVVPSKKGRTIHQSKIGTSGRMLLRVIVKDDGTVYHVVSAYKTSKVTKYWK